MTSIPSKTRVRLNTNQHQARTNPSTSSTSLVERARSGDIAAFEQLVLANHRSVRAFLARYLQRTETVDDVAQEVFLAAFKQMKQFRVEAKFSTWLLGIARNKALHCLRTELRQRNNQKQFLESGTHPKNIVTLNEMGDVATEELRLEALDECLKRLPVQSRSLIQSFYFERQTAVSIAQQHDQKESSIRMKLKRIRSVLQTSIKSKMKTDLPRQEEK